MTSYNELRDGQEFYGNGYKNGYKQAIIDGKTNKALRDFSEWVKTQPIYVGRRHINGYKEILIIREGKSENAIEAYIKEKEA